MIWNKPQGVDSIPCLAKMIPLILGMIFVTQAQGQILTGLDHRIYSATNKYLDHLASLHQTSYHHRKAPQSKSLLYLQSTSSPYARPHKSRSIAKYIPRKNDTEGSRRSSNKTGLVAARSWSRDTEGPTAQSKCLHYLCLIFSFSEEHQNLSDESNYRFPKSDTWNRSRGSGWAQSGFAELCSHYEPISFTGMSLV